MRKLASVVIAAAAVLSVIAVAGVASAEKIPPNCDQCLVGVSADGTLFGQRGVASSRRLGAGLYEVTFKRTIAGVRHHSQPSHFQQLDDQVSQCLRIGDFDVDLPLIAPKGCDRISAEPFAAGPTSCRRDRWAPPTSRGA